MAANKATIASTTINSINVNPLGGAFIVFLSWIDDEVREICSQAWWLASIYLYCRAPTTEVSSQKADRLEAPMLPPVVEPTKALPLLSTVKVSDGVVPLQLASL